MIDSFAVYVFCAVRDIIPQILNDSINLNLFLEDEEIVCELGDHVDGCGSEVLCGIIIYAPPNIPNLFNQYQRADPSMSSGFCGKESQWNVAAEQLIEELETVHKYRYTVTKYPNCGIWLKWSIFLRDRHCLGPTVGVKISTASYPSVYTIEHRSWWSRIGLVEGGRFPNLASHVYRAIGWHKVNNDKSLSSRQKERQKMADEMFGGLTENGGSFLTPQFLRNPDLGELTPMPPTFHIKSSVTTGACSRGLYFMEKMKVPQFSRLKRDWEIYNNHIVQGKIASSATHMFKYSLSVMDYLHDALLINRITHFFLPMPLLFQNVLTKLTTHTIPSTKWIAEFRAYGLVYYSFVCLWSRFLTTHVGAKKSTVHFNNAHHRDLIDWLPDFIEKKGCGALKYTEGPLENLFLFVAIWESQLCFCEFFVQI